MRPKPYPKNVPSPATQGPIPEGWDVFLDPKTDPIGGMNTAVHPMALPDGKVVLLQNLRNGTGIPTLRGGVTASLGTILASSTYRGHWQGYLWGSYRTMVALYDATRTRVYGTTDWASWTEYTASSGAFGNTRMTGNAPVSFAVVPDPMSLPTDTSTERLLFTDGTGSVRELVNDPPQSGVANLTTCLLSNVTPPNTSELPVRVLSIEFSMLNIQGTPTTVDSTTDLVWTNNGSSPNRQSRLTISTSVDDGDNCTIALSSGSSVGTSIADRQLLIGVDTSYMSLWDKFKLELGSVTLWDPDSPSTTTRPVAIPLQDGSNRTIWAFPYPAVTAAGTISGDLKFTWCVDTTEAPSVATTVDFFLFALTYGSPAMSDWEIAGSLASTTSNAESPAAIYSDYVTQRIKDYGGPVINEAKLPRSPLLKALYKAKVKNPITADKDVGVDSVRFYYRQPGAKRFRFLKTQTLTTISGSTWSYSSGASEGITEVTAGPTSQFYNLPEVYMPDAYQVTVPTSQCLAFTNNRLFAGGASGATRNLYISENRNAFRMRRFSPYEDGRLDPDAPIVGTAGNAPVQAIVPLNTSLQGVSMVYVFTADGIYITGGTDSNQLQQIARVSEFGTISPLSIAKLYNRIFYLDTEGQIRRLTGGTPEPISKYEVDTILKAIPADMKPYAVGAVSNELYFLSYAESGQTINTATLVWDDTRREWSYDTIPSSVKPAALVSWFDGTNKKKRLMMFGSASGTVNGYEYDLSTQSQDLGTTNISAAITWPEIHFPDGHFFEYTEFGIMADDMASATATVVVTYKPTGATDTFSSSIDVSGNQSLRKLQDPTASGTPRGVAATVALTVSGTAGKRIYKFLGKRKADGSGFDAV